MLVRDRSKASDDYLVDVIEQYRAVHGSLPHSMDFVAEWALNQRKVEPSRRSLIKDIARQLSRAARHQRHRDPQGRLVRTFHAAKYHRLTKGGQLVFETMWDHIQTMSAEHARISFSQRLGQIEGECRSLKTDRDSFVDNNPNAGDTPPYLSFNFDAILDDDAVHNQTESLATSEFTEALARKKPR